MVHMFDLTLVLFLRNRDQRTVLSYRKHYVFVHFRGARERHIPRSVEEMPKLENKVEKVNI